MSVQYHSGKNSKAFVGSNSANVELSLISWAVTPAVEVARFRTSKTGLFSQKETTFLDATVEVVVEHDFLLSPYSTSGGNLSLINGATMALALYLSGTVGAGWQFGSAILVGNPQSSAVEGKINTTMRFEANGAWTEPTTSP
jgi:hypothetical protein